MRKPKFQRLLGAITQDVKTSLRLHSLYVEQPETLVKLKGSGTLLSPPSQVDNPLKLGSLPPMTTPELVTATTAVHTLVGTSSPTVASVKGTYLQPKLCVKSREYHALHLFDKMPKSTGLCNAGRTSYALTTNRDKGGELAHQPEAYENSKEEDKNVNRSVGKNDQADDGHAMLKIELSTCLIKRNDVLTHKKKVPIDEIVVGESHVNENGQFLAHKVDVQKHLETKVVNGHVSDKSGDESLIIHSHQENISEPDLADTTEESGSSNKACGCQNVHVEKSFSTIVNGDVILGYTSEAFIGMVLRFNMESTNEGKLQTTQRPATHPGIFDASHDSTKAFFELPDKGISGLITSKLECKSSLESEDLHSNVATKPVSELDDIFMGHIFMLGCTRPPEDGECWNLDGKTCSQVVRGFLDNRNATVLETLIIEAQKLDSPTIMVDISGCYGIINACIGTTLSDEAHVTFDEKNAQGIILGSYVHVPILKACSNEHKVAEAIQMLMQISNSELKMDMDLALISEYVSEDKSLHVLLQWHKLKRNSLVDGEKGLIFVDNMVDAFLYALVKGDRHPPLLLPYLIVFVMGEALTSLELLQHEYHNIDLVDLAAVIAIAFTQLHLSHEAADTYKDLIMMTGHKRDVGEYLTWTFMHSKLPHNPNSHNL